MSLFTELKRELESYLDTEQVEEIYRAYRFAAEAHKGQQRHSGDPYITHPLAVALILGEMRMDPQTIMSAILHDVIEDTGIEKAALGQEFGADVAELVDGVSKLTQIQFRNRAEAQAENFRKMLLAMAKDIRVILIKLSDRLHNMRTLGVLPPNKSQRIALETLEIYAPIAHRLGMHSFRIEFEDLGFAALYPMRYRIIQEAVRKAKRSRKGMVSHIEGSIKDRLEQLQLPPSIVWARNKHLYSIYKEMKTKHLSFNEIMDDYTFCIVVDHLDTCYRVLGAIHNLYKPLPEKFRDYIALPKANGYQALHTTVFGPYGAPVSIQIRTADMDNVADSGIASHWLLNSPEETTHPTHVRAGEWLKRLLDIQLNTTENPLEFIENVKIDLFPEEVYIFTPKGDILELPKNATPVDLAYAIHSDIGDTCIGVRIDRRMASLSTPLVNGQTVEIITTPDAKPNPAWLNFVVTGKARSNIRHFLKSQHQIEAIDFGKRLLEAALAALGTEWSQLTGTVITTVLHQFEYSKEEDLLEAIGLGTLVAPLIAQRLTNQTHTQDDSVTHPLRIKGTEGMMVHFASCCRPIPGDPIVGVLNSGQGITVHAQPCKQLINLHRRHPERCVHIGWDEQTTGNFTVDVRVEAANKQGVLAQLATAIAAAKANIDNVSVENRGQDYCIVHLTLSVHNRVHLAQVLRRLRLVKAVTRLTRGK